MSVLCLDLNGSIGSIEYLIIQYSASKLQLKSNEMICWKYSFERLSKHKYVTYIIHPKKVVYICEKKRKLNQKWKEDYLDRHVCHSGCKANKGQRTIYNWFHPKQVEQVEEEEEYDSDIYDNMESVWKVDCTSNAVRAKICTGVAENRNLCNECSFIRYNKILRNKIVRPLPLPSNIKFTPKHYWEDNPLKRYLQNCDLRDIWNTFNNESKNQLENL
ncbi:hypothetical protein C1645_823241 [Glomus cerebriforme]|uniref:Uncharacterized protein n=1 Tax=Glomus cerebriforme TaxID=658196 RepID=A0A397T5Z8_9GLOM|nr:hypothetical protein C1645_823241 [Glomus cerebriforme]